MKLKKIDLLNGSVPKSLFLFALPNILTYFANYLFYAVDIFVLSLSGAGGEISAVMSSLTPISLCYGLLLGASVGGTFLVGQYHGAKDIEGRRKAIISFGFFMMIFSILLTIIIASFSSLIVTWLNVDPSLQEKAIRYLLIASLTIPFQSLTYFVNGVYKGCGRSIFPFIYTASGIALNLALDFLFVYGLNMRSDGAAISLITSFVITGICASLYIIFKDKGLKRLGKITIDKNNIKRIVKYALPLCIQEFIVSASLIVLVSCMNMLGSDYATALTISDRISNMYYVGVLGINNALSAAIAQNLGAYKVDRCKRFVRWGILISAISIVIYALPIALSSYQLSSLYTDSETIRQLTIQRTWIIFFNVGLCIFLYPFQAIQSGSGHSINSMLTFLIPDVLLRIPLTLIFSFCSLPFYVISLSYPISTILCIVIAIYLYRKGSWKNLKKLPVTQDIYIENNLSD